MPLVMMMGCEWLLSIYTPMRPRWKSRAEKKKSSNTTSSACRLTQKKPREVVVCSGWVFIGCFLVTTALVFFPFRLLQLQEQMRALYKAISAPRVRRASSKGGGGYTCQSGSGWDEFTKRLTGECLGWMRQQRVSGLTRAPSWMPNLGGLDVDGGTVSPSPPGAATC